MIQPGDRLPNVTLYEMTEAGPTPVELAHAVAGRRVVIFGLPGAFTPTCSARHLPGFVERAEALESKGVAEILCIAVNDAFVMGAWGQAHHAGSKVRMLADGNGEFARATGLTLDLTARGMWLRSQRYSMLVEDGVVKLLNVDAPGEFKVSDADTLLAQLDAL